MVDCKVMVGGFFLIELQVDYNSEIGLINWNDLCVLYFGLFSL